MSSTWKIILTVVVTALVIGTGTYWYVNGKADTDKAALQSSIDNLNKKVAELEKPDTITKQSTTTSSDPMADWKTYANSTYYYSFKYPASVTLYSFTGEGTDTSITTTAQIVHAKKSNAQIMEISDLSTSQSLIDYINSNWSAATNKVTTSATIAGTTGYKVVIGSTDYYYIEKNGKKLQVSLDPTDSTASQMFTSFAFTK